MSEKLRLAALFAGKLACPAPGHLNCGSAAAESRMMSDFILQSWDLH
jgi:hypothetical protein